jgi:hypothetical protein
MTEFQKAIYNCYLRNYRHGEPYRPRQNFDNLDENSKSYLVRLSNFFGKYPQIKINDFFEAPRLLHPDEKYPNLAFFLSRPAIRTYTMAFRKQEERNPMEQKDEIKKGFHFIGMFCLKNKIYLNSYIEHKTGLMYSWMKHYNEHDINPYCIMELGDVMSQIYRMPEDERELYAKEISENFGKMKQKYHNSPEIKDFVQAVTKKIEDFVKKSLTTDQKNATLKQ